jgi:hypothetical protein
MDAWALAGSRELEVVEADAASQFVRHLAEATLTLVLFTDTVRVNLGRLRHESLVPARLLGIGLPLTIVAGTLVALALLPGLDLWTAAALATMLAPTDAALGLPVVSNRRLPSRIRQGLNDAKSPDRQKPLPLTSDQVSEMISPRPNAKADAVKVRCRIPQGCVSPRALPSPSAGDRSRSSMAAPQRTLIPGRRTSSA